MIELPFPDKILWPNGRGHHMAKHRAFQKHKTWAWAALCADRNYAHAGGRVRWSVTFYPKTRNAIDDDNARASLTYMSGSMAVERGFADAMLAADQVKVDDDAQASDRHVNDLRALELQLVAAGQTRTEARARINKIKGTPGAALDPATTPGAGGNDLTGALAGLLANLQN